MIYAKRDADGRIAALYPNADEPGVEALPMNDPEVLAFLDQAGDSEAALAFLHRSDLELVRVMEDLIELLVDRNLILFTDLPEPAQRKLLGRRKARENLADDRGLMVDRDDVL